MASYSERMLKFARANRYDRVDKTPIFMPVGRIKPETFNEAMNRILMTSAGQGMTLQEAYDSIRGDYDVDDYSDDYDDYDDYDEFEQSSLAQYIEPKVEHATHAPSYAPQEPSSAETKSKVPSEQGHIHPAADGAADGSGLRGSVATAPTATTPVQTENVTEGNK